MNPHRDQSSGVPHSLWLEDATTLRAPGHADTHETRSTETPQLKGGAVDSLGSVPSSSKTVQWRADVVAQSVGSDFADTGFSSRPKSKSPGSSGQTPLQREEDDSAASVRQSGHSWCPPGEDEEEDEDVTLAARDYDDPSLQDDRSFRGIVCISCCFLLSLSSPLGHTLIWEGGRGGEELTSCTWHLRLG